MLRVHNIQLDALVFFQPLTFFKDLYVVIISSMYVATADAEKERCISHRLPAMIH